MAVHTRLLLDLNLSNEKGPAAIAMAVAPRVKESSIESSIPLRRRKAFFFGGAVISSAGKSSGSGASIVMRKVSRKPLTAHTVSALWTSGRVCFPCSRWVLLGDSGYDS